MRPDFKSLPLSERESEILMLAAEGLTDKEISERLGVAEGSVRTYWDRTRHKLSARSRGEAIAKALKEGYESALTALAEAQEWARIMVAGTHDLAMFRIDKEGKILTWNPGVAAVLHYSESDFVGQNIDLIFTAADRAIGAAEQERMVAAEAGRSIDSRWHVRRDGVKIWVEGAVIALLRDGEPIGFAKILQDRTDEYQARREVERLQGLVAELTGVKSDPGPLTSPES